MTAPPTTVDTDTFIEAARLGDAAAAASVVSEYLPYWMGAARLIIARNSRSLALHGSREEPADLVQEAIVKLLELWRQGKGPQSNTRQYVATMMQHAYANKMRSPRTRERALESIETETPFATTDDYRDIDLSRETDRLRRAFKNLAPDHRDVLLAVTAEGRKPGELTEHFERPAPAISNLLARAKQSLFRLLLIEHLRDGGEPCAANAQDLPARVQLEATAHRRQEQGVAHVLDCERCQHNWRRFAAVSSAFGVLPLLTVAQLAASSAPASALPADGPDLHPDAETAPDAATQADSSATSPSPSQSQSQSQPQPQPQLPGSPAAPPALAGAGSAAGAGAGAAAASGAAPLQAGISAARTPATQTLAASIAAAVGSTATIAVGIGLVALAGLVVLAGLAGLVPPLLSERTPDASANTTDLAELNPYGATLDVQLDTHAGGALRAITVDFAVDEPVDWSIDEIVLTVSPGTQVRSASNGLNCTFGSSSSCRPTDRTDLGGTFVFDVDSTEPDGAFALEIRAKASGDSGTARATGTW